MTSQKPEDKSILEKAKETISQTYESAKDTVKKAVGMDEAQKENLEYKTGLKKDTGSKMKEGAQTASEKVKEGTQSASEKLKEGAQNVADKVKEQTEKMRQQK